MPLQVDLHLRWRHEKSSSQTAHVAGGSLARLLFLHFNLSKAAQAFLNAAVPKKKEYCQ